MIPQDTYQVIHRLVPLACSDIVVLCGSETLLLLRNKEPLKGEWFIPGGRILKGEKAEDAAIRKVWEECGLNPIQPLKLLGVEEIILKKDPFGHGKGTHTVNFIYAAHVAPGSNVKIDEHQNAFRWVSCAMIGTLGLHPYVVRNVGRALA